MLARELMRREVFTVREDQPLEDLIEILLREHIHGAPVIDEAGDLSGVVTQQDIFFSAATLNRGKKSEDPPDAASQSELLVRDVMTSPAVSASEDTDVKALCRMMHRLRIHRVPIVKGNRVTGIVSSLDVCSAVASGKLS